MRFLAFMSFVFLAGNNILHGGLLAFCRTERRGMETHHVWFSAWLAWGFVCSLAALNPWTSLLGSFNRMEGWVTWVLMARMAHVWGGRKVGPMTLAMTVGLLAGTAVCRQSYLMPVAMGGFLATAWPVLLGMGMSMVPALAALPLLAVSGCRVAVVAVAATSIPWLIGKVGRLQMILLVGITTSIVALSPLGEKFAHINFKTLGHGARVAWLRQSWSLSLDRPIVGYGYDNIMFVLRNPKVEYAPDRTPDRTHNFAADIVLQTGWVGFALWMAAMGTAARKVWRNPTQENRTLLAAVAGWCIFGLLNPQGAPAHALMLTCFWGITDKEKP